ncbi:Spo0E family sporulation regulatory protein-aspartic acid phosphatase [Paenibacillus solani]|uniref:Spo0E family sporulation regulatory protein-aspartic acid phosphatase n=1 Tax=Paenibacillus solani TaxID=1705565 RepID=UPI003D292545
MDEYQTLITKFELLRHELNLLNESYPLESQEVITKSQELDRLHNEIEAYKKNRHTKRVSSSN